MRVLAILLCSFSFCSYTSKAQKIDSLLNELSTSGEENRLAILMELANSTLFSNTKESRNYSKEALAIASRDEISVELAKIYNMIGISYDIQGLADSSKYYFNKYYTTSKSLGNMALAGNALNNLGMANWNTGRFETALDYFFLSLNIADSLNDEVSQAKSFNNIGLIYQELNDYPRALNYNLKALKLRIKNRSKQINHSYNNIGICYKNLNQLDSALHYYQLGLEAVQQTDVNGKAQILHNIGNVYLELGQYEKAIEYCEESLSYKDDNTSNLLVYSTLSEIYFLSRNSDKSIYHGLRALEYAEGNNNFGHQEDIYFNLTRAYALANNISAFEKYAELWDAVKDSIFSEQSTKAYSELELQYETQKKEQQIKLQNAQLAENEALIKLNQTLLVGVIITFILIIIVVFLWIKKKRKNQLIELQNEKIKGQVAVLNASITSQEKERARYARDLHDGFGQYISLLNINLKNLESDASAGERSEIFVSSSKVIDSMYDELRNICFDLMPKTLLANGLESAYSELTQRINKTGRLSIELNVFGLDERLNELQEISLYRICQEWINNVLKYSDATKLTLQLTADNTEITLMLEDNGQGFDKSLLLNGKGNGWKNLKTRTNVIEGVIDLESSPGKRGNVLILNAPRYMKDSVEENNNAFDRASSSI